jgi:hypothetical protein
MTPAFNGVGTQATGLFTRAGSSGNPGLDVELLLIWLSSIYLRSKVNASDQSLRVHRFYFPSVDSGILSEISGLK